VKLIASNISNLTDARFFAAYAPEVLILPWSSGLDLVNAIQWLEEVRPWIEGPDWAIRWSENNTSEDLLLAKNAEIKVLVLEGNNLDQAIMDFEYILEVSNQPIEWLQDHRGRGIILNVISQLDKVAVFTLTTDVYLKVRTISDWHQLEGIDHKIDGIVLQGGQEEKVGVKSFDEIHDLLERFDLS
jgi:hypothetical protein